MTKNYRVKHGFSLFTEYDIHLFKEGMHFKLYEKLGSHVKEFDGNKGTLFSVWAPNADSVSVIGDFNLWNPNSHKLAARWDSSGIWEGFIPEIEIDCLYKYAIKPKFTEKILEKADPFAFQFETPPKTASVVSKLNYKWEDKFWLDKREKLNNLESPISVYEIHLGSWKRFVEEDGRFLNYKEMAYEISKYLKDMGFTHVEFLPVMEHPYYGSWGYQCLGYFAPTNRYGSPQDFMFLIDHLHQNDIGVILDWVPSHFPVDEHGLGFFDGTHLYEHADPRKGFHPDWKSYIFNYGRNEVRSFLVSSAMFWLDKYHIDSLRVDAVASLLYLDYSRNEGEWIPNEFGGRENNEAINLIRLFNKSAYEDYPGVQTVAEESTAWPMVSKPIEIGGLGFGMKWNMGWMNDTLAYFSTDTVYRKYHQNQLTFSLWYAFTENFMLPLSHDEVVHGKGSLIGKMPGDNWQKFANLRALFGYMFGHPGKKLLFMGSEFGQWKEWDHNSSLDWHLTQYKNHSGLQKWVRDLNLFYRNEPCLYEIDFSYDGFEWIDFSDADSSIISFMRKDKSNNTILVVCNFTPVTRKDYPVGVTKEGIWKECLNSDSRKYGGSGYCNSLEIESQNKPANGRELSIKLNIPPLGVTFLKPKSQ